MLYQSCFEKVTSAFRSVINTETMRAEHEDTGSPNRQRYYFLFEARLAISSLDATNGSRRKMIEVQCEEILSRHGVVANITSYREQLG